MSDTTQLTTMQAAVADRLGPPEVLEPREIAPPEIGDDEALVRVHAAGVDPSTWHIMAGAPYLVRLMGFGLRQPKTPVSGQDLVGVVEKGRRRGDPVPARRGGLRHRRRTYAVQIAKALGADHVVDYTREDPVDGSHRYDLIVDCAGNRPLRTLRRALAPQGTLVIVGGEGGGRWLGGTDRLLRAVLLSPFVGQRLRGLYGTTARTTSPSSRSTSRPARSPQHLTAPSRSSRRPRPSVTCWTAARGGRSS